MQRTDFNDVKRAKGFGHPIENLRMAGATPGGLSRDLSEVKRSGDRMVEAGKLLDAQLQERLKDVPDGFERVKRVQMFVASLGLLLFFGGSVGAFILPFVLADSFGESTSKR